MNDNRSRGNLIGISIKNSHASMRGNHLRGNSEEGIRVEYDVSDGPVDPPIVALIGNVAHDNGQGISLESGTVLSPDPVAAAPEPGTADARNWVWGNAQPSGYQRRIQGLMFAPPEEFPWVVLAPDPAAVAVDDRAFADALATAPHGPLTAELEADGVPDAEAMARYLTSGGCVGCLSRWWNGEGHAPAAPPPTGGRRYVAQGHEDGITFTRTCDEAGIEHLWRTLSHVATNHDAAREGMPSEDDAGAAIHRIGVVGVSDAALDQFEADLRLLSRIEPYAPVNADTVPAGAGGIVGAVRNTALTVAPPFVIDHLGRSIAALDGRGEDLPPLGAAELMEGRTRLGEAVSLLARTGKFWLITMSGGIGLALGAIWVGHRKGFEGALSDPLGAILHALSENAKALQLLDYISLPALILGGMALAGSLVLRLLPRPLHPLPDSWISQRLTAGRENRDTPDSPPWRRWIVRRIFHADVVTIVLRRVLEWSDADRRALAALLDTRPKKCAVVLVLQTNDRERVDRALLRPLVKGEDPVTLDGLALTVEPGDVAEPSETPTLRALLGLKTEEAVERHRVGIRSAAFGVGDILPLLILGSRPGAAFSLSRPADPTRARFVGPLNDAIAPYARFFDDGQESGIVFDGDELEELDHQARTSTAIDVHRPKGDETTTYAGRIAMRPMLIEALKEVFGEDDAARFAYVDAMTGTGRLALLNRATARLSGHPGVREISDAVAVQSAYGLAEETPSSVFRQSMLITATEAVLRAIDTITPDTDEPESLAATSHLFAASLVLRLDAGSTMSKALEGEGASDDGAARAFRARLMGTARGFDALDRRHARRLTRIALHPERRALHPDLHEAFDVAVERTASENASFGTLLAGCTGSDPNAGSLDATPDRGMEDSPLPPSLGDADVVALLNTLSHRSPLADGDAQPDIRLGSFAPLQGRVEKPVRIAYLEHADPEHQSTRAG